jgi:hypothetical protein
MTSNRSSGPLVDRSIWIDFGQNPDNAKFTANGINCAYFDGRWIAAKTDPIGYLKSVKTSSVGLYLCDPHQWPNTGPTDPVAWAKWGYDLIQHHAAPGTGGDWPRVDLNYEQDDPQWLLAMLRQWRKNNPHRTTAFVVQANKASIYAPVAQSIAALNVIVKPECFVGNMQRVESSHEIQSWAAAGIPNSLLEPMLDASQLGAFWSGTCFTMGRLP